MEFSNKFCDKNVVVVYVVNLLQLKLCWQPDCLLKHFILSITEEYVRLVMTI